MIGLVVIATGKYLQFIPQLWRSANKYFLTSHQHKMFVLSDGEIDLDNTRCCHVSHETWPGPTLHRYRSILEHQEVFADTDYLFMIDADMRFAGNVNDEILGKTVATIHPGFYSQDRSAYTYDGNADSLAYVASDEGTRYFAGGFQGGRTPDYLGCVTELARRIAEDEKNNITALWHDESHWNRYLIDSPPEIQLSPSYCYPEGWGLPFEPRILALNKAHDEMRT